LLTIGMEEAAKAYTWNWEQKARIEARAALNPNDPPAEYHYADEKPAGGYHLTCLGSVETQSQAISGGQKQLRFWNVDPQTGSMIVKIGVYTKGLEYKCKLFTSVRIKRDGMCLAGTSKGDIAIVVGTVIMRIVNAPFQSLRAWGSKEAYELANAPNGVMGIDVAYDHDVIVSVDSGGNLVVWDSNLETTIDQVVVNDLDLPVGMCAVSTTSEGIAVGTRAGQIKWYDWSDIKKSSGSPEKPKESKPFKRITKGHFAECDCAPHPAKPMLASCSLDHTVRVWSLINHSELSCMRFDSGVSCLAFRVNDHSEAAGQFWSLIVGMESGEIAELRIYSENDHKAAIHKTDASWHSEAWPTQEIEQVECSPNGQWIVAGTSKGGIEVFDGTVPGLKHVWRCAHSTRTKSLDFSVDGSILRSTDMAGELLLWNLPNRVQESALERRDEAWQTWTSVRGWHVNGVWPKNAMLNHVRTCSRSESRKLVVTGDKDGLVKLFNYPCPQWGSKYKEYRMHSSFVQGVRFSHNDKYVISTGGLRDCSIAMWEVQHCKCPQCHVTSAKKRSRRRSSCFHKVQEKADIIIAINSLSHSNNDPELLDNQFADLLGAEPATEPADAMSLLDAPDHAEAAF